MVPTPTRTCSFRYYLYHAHQSVYLSVQYLSNSVILELLLLCICHLQPSSVYINRVSTIHHLYASAYYQMYDTNYRYDQVVALQTGIYASGMHAQMSLCTRSTLDRRWVNLRWGKLTYNGIVECQLTMMKMRSEGCTVRKATLSHCRYDVYSFLHPCLPYHTTASSSGVQPDVVKECERNRIHTRLLTQSSDRLEVSQYAEDSYTDWSYLEVTSRSTVCTCDDGDCSRHDDIFLA